MRFTAPKGTELLLIRTGADFSEAERTPVIYGEVSARAVVIFLAAVRRCPACIAKLPCKHHGPDALKAAEEELGLSGPPPEPPDPDRENIKLSDLWIAKWLEHYGTAAEKAEGKLARRPLTVVHFRVIAEARKEHGFQLLRDAIEGVFANPFYTAERKAVPDILAVMRNPSKFAAMRLARTTKRGSGQGAPEGWAP